MARCRRHAALALSLFLAVLIPGGAVAAEGPSSGGAWSARTFLPHQAAYGSWVEAYAATCPAPQRCVVVAEYQPPAQPRPTEALEWTEGRSGWSAPAPLPGLARLARRGATVQALACGAVGSCVVVGTYEDADFRSHSFLVSSSAGRWHDAVDVHAADGNGGLFGAACGAAGDCVVVGSATDQRPLVVVERNGTWASPATLGGASGTATLVACPTALKCEVGGERAASGVPFVDALVDGRWGAATELPGLAALSTGGHAELRGLACPAPGDCAAVGDVTETGGAVQPFVDLAKEGSWARSTIPPGASALNAAGQGWLGSVACPAVGDCTAVGEYQSGSGAFSRAFAVSATNGAWREAVPLPGAAATSAEGSDPLDVACWSSGDCTTVGYAQDESGLPLPFADTQVGSTWASSTLVGGYTPHSSERAGLNWVACAHAFTCTAIGRNDSNETRVIALTEAPRRVGAS